MKHRNRCRKSIEKKHAAKRMSLSSPRLPAEFTPHSMRCRLADVKLKSPYEVAHVNTLLRAQGTGDMNKLKTARNRANKVTQRFAKKDAVQVRNDE